MGESRFVWKLASGTRPVRPQQTHPSLKAGASQRRCSGPPRTHSAARLGAGPFLGVTAGVNCRRPGGARAAGPGREGQNGLPVGEGEGREGGRPPTPTPTPGTSSAGHGALRTASHARPARPQQRHRPPPRRGPGSATSPALPSPRQQRVQRGGRSAGRVGGISPSPLCSPVSCSRAPTLRRRHPQSSDTSPSSAESSPVPVRGVAEGGALWNTGAPD